MSLDPQIITAGMTTPEPIQSPNDVAEGLAKTRVYQGQADELAAQAQERVRAASDDAAARTALMAHPNDPDAAVGTLIATGHPNAAFKIQSTLTAQRKAAAEAADAEIKTHTARANYIGQSLNGADPTNQADWSTRVNGILAQFADPDERAQMAQQLAGAKTPDDVAKIRATGETTEKYLDQQQSALALLSSGKTMESAASLLLSQPDQAHYDAALSGMKSMFPASIVAQMPTTFGPDSQAQLKQLAIPVAEQERFKGEAAARAQTAKNEAANLAVSQARLKVEQDREGRLSSAGTAAGSTGTADPNKPNGDAYLKTLSPSEANTVKALAEGRIPWPTGAALRAGPWSARIDEALQYDPTLDTGTISNNARVKVRQDFTSGKSAQTINALNTVIGHITHLADLGDKLDNTGLDFANSVRNWLTPGGSDRGATINSFDLAKQAVASELTRVYRQAGGSEQDIQGWQKSINAAKSPQELSDAWRTIGGLLESKLGAMQDQYQQGMGTTPVNVVTPQSRTALDRLQGTSSPKSSGGFSVSYHGKTYTFPSQDKLDGFKRELGIK
jgi:YHS domain-containing protein